ncbi:rab3 gtpase-activating protein catalytic subunit [Holotrichia oblita]|uniref:Rab3 gtpase-activating protein catalytic subunit n=1 Tax=Holotrichia oblita TaxID=644536 RepID=A0ACB9TBI4_HOLOL|nr:rab3 gtpase-activating protein catalytic subunit [Holotrichia oblita]
MNEEIDEAEFYHQDFTTASEWEIFISRIEEVIREWKIQETKDSDKDVPLQGQWWCRSDNIQFADIRFQLSCYKHKSIISLQQENEEDDSDNASQSKNPIDADFDFVLDDGDNSNVDKCIATWYGLKEYIVLTAHDSSVIISPSPIKILLSSVTIAVANTGCEIPIFVQIRDKWQRLYLGVYEGNAIRTNYDMIHLGKCPQHCRYLSGLLDLFKTKIMSPTPLDPIVVSVQLTYHLTDFGKYVWKQDMLDMENSSFDTTSLTILPFGVSYDPISCIILKATWSQLPDHLIVDTEIYSDLNPMQAPQWSVSVKMSEQPVCLLAECLTEFIQLLNINLTVYDVLGDFVTPINSTPENNPLDVLTEPHIPTISSVLKRATRPSSSANNKAARKSSAPVSEDNLEPLIYFLFPDAENQPQFPYNNEQFQKEKLKDEHVPSDTKNHENLFRGYKTCSYDSLVWRLAIVLAQAAESLGGTKALAHLWYEFSQEMRYRWEKSYLIPG